MNLKPPRIPYRETITASTEAHGRHKKQTGGHGQFGDCKIRLEPLPRGADFEFVDDIFGGSIPRQFVPAVEKGIQDARLRGYLAGYPVVDFKVTVFDGSFHPVDSNELSFKLAGSLAFKDAMTRARPTILEPVMNVEVYAPSDYAGDLMGDLNGRRGRIGGMDTRGAMTVIKAQVPMSEMLTYEQQLTSATGGRGSYHMEYSHYEEVPAHQQTKIIAAAKAERGQEVEVGESSADDSAMRSPSGLRLGSSCWPSSCAARAPSSRARLAPALAASSARRLGLSAFFPRRRSAAARRRPPTPSLRLRGCAPPSASAPFGIELAADQLDLRDFRAVAPAEAEPQQPRVAARPRLEPRRKRVEQLGDDLLVVHVAHARGGARVSAGRSLACGEAALGDRDQALDERAQLLRLRHRRLDALVAEQRRRPGSAASRCGAR